MNIYPFRIFLGKKNWGKSHKILQKLKSSPVFRRARFDVYIPRKDSGKIVVCLGQVHSVLTGKMYWFTAKKIGKTQARLFTYYNELFRLFGIRAFGEEGVTCDVQEGYFRYHLDALTDKLPRTEQDEIKKRDVPLPFIRKILVQLAMEWHVALKKSPQNAKMVAPSASLVSGARLFSLKNHDSVFFAIEGEKAYRFTLRHITRLQKEIYDLQHHYAFKKAKGKGFKRLTQEEYDIVKKLNDRVKTFNNVLKAPLRDEATLNVCREHTEKDDIVVFTMGIGHRRKFLRLANSVFKTSGVSFLIITPPEIWLWEFAVKCLKWGAVLALVVGAVGGWRMSG